MIEVTKNECSDKPFTADWGDVYIRFGTDPVTDPITVSTWAPTGVTVGADSIDGALTTVQLSGGTAGTTATLVNEIQIPSLNFRECETFIITVE